MTDETYAQNKNSGMWVSKSDYISMSSKGIAGNLVVGGVSSGSSSSSSSSNTSSSSSSTSSSPNYSTTTLNGQQVKVFSSIPTGQGDAHYKPIYGSNNQVLGYAQFGLGLAPQGTLYGSTTTTTTYSNGISSLPQSSAFAPQISSPNQVTYTKTQAPTNTSTTNEAAITARATELKNDLKDGDWWKSVGTAASVGLLNPMEASPLNLLFKDESDYWKDVATKEKEHLTNSGYYDKKTNYEYIATQAFLNPSTISIAAGAGVGLGLGAISGAAAGIGVPTAGKIAHVAIGGYMAYEGANFFLSDAPNEEKAGAAQLLATSFIGLPGGLKAGKAIGNRLAVDLPILPGAQTAETALAKGANALRNPVHYSEIKLGEDVYWRGVTYGQGASQKMIGGISDKGFRGINIGGHPKVGAGFAQAWSEAKVSSDGVPLMGYGQVEAIARTGVAPAADVAQARNLIGLSDALKLQPSSKINPVSGKFKSLTNEQGELLIQLERSVQRTHGGVAYGSKTAYHQLGDAGRLPGDSDISINIRDSSKIAADWSKQLNSIKGGYKTRVSKTTPTLIESKINGEWVHAVDTHDYGSAMAISQLGNADALANTKLITTKGNNIIAEPLGKQFVRKTAAFSFREEGVLPSVDSVAHRLKDVPDFINIGERLHADYASTKSAKMFGETKITFSGQKPITTGQMLENTKAYYKNNPLTSDLLKNPDYMITPALGTGTPSTFVTPSAASSVMPAITAPSIRTAFDSKKIFDDNKVKTNYKITSKTTSSPSPYKFKYDYNIKITPSTSISPSKRFPSRSPSPPSKSPSGSPSGGSSSTSTSMSLSLSSFSPSPSESPSSSISPYYSPSSSSKRTPPYMPNGFYQGNMTKGFKLPTYRAPSKTKYAPSLTAIALGIRGKKPKGITGLEIRPMLTKRKTRKRKR